MTATVKIRRRKSKPKPPRRGDDGTFAKKKDNRKSGRTHALAALDELVGSDRNRKRIMHALQAELDNDPVAFWLDFVVPLIPREALHRVESPSVVPLRIILSASDVDDPVAPSGVPGKSS